jgi:ribosomal protein L27
MRQRREAAGRRLGRQATGKEAVRKGWTVIRMKNDWKRLSAYDQ